MPDASFTSSYQLASVASAALHRAYRDLRLYPPNHPTARETVASFATAVRRYMDEWGPLRFEVQENTLLVDGEVVYQHETTRDNVAFLLFRDGVRSLSLNQGVDATEVDGLVDCLAHADDLVEMEQDIVTALWERDFSNIDYQVVDPFLGGEVLGEDMVDTLREHVLQRLENTESAALMAAKPEQAALAVVMPVRVDTTSLRLAPQEIQTGEQAADGVSSVLEDFTEVLLEIASNPRIPVEDDVLARPLSGVVAALLDGGDVSGASFVLRRLKEVGASVPSRSPLAGLVAAGAITAEHLRHLIRHVAASPGREAQDAETFLTSVKGWALPSLMEVLAETDDRAMRKTVLGLLASEGAPWRDLEPFLHDPRWYVVRNAVQLGAAAGHEQLMDYIPRLLRHPDVRVRREAIRALHRLGSGAAAENALAQGLSDPDSSVRTLAAGAAARGGGSQVETLLVRHIGDRGFPSLPPEEVEAFLAGYAQVAQERAIPLLEQFWRKRLFSSRPMNVRVAALLALGRIKGPAAGALLQEASKSNDVQMQRAAAQAAQIRASIISGGAS